MKVNSALYNPYTGIIKNISLLQNELTPDYYIIKSSVTDRKKFDTEFLFDEVGAGCSLSYEKAMLSSIGEAVERYCGNIPMNEIIEKSKQELENSGEKYFSIESFISYPESTKKAVGFPFKKLENEEKIPWIRGYNLFNKQEEYFVPITMVYVNYKTEGKNYNFPNLSGLASGTSLNQAISGAVLEIIERDASIRWWYFDTEEKLIRKTVTDNYVFLSYQIDAIVPTVASFLFDLKNELVSVGFASRFDFEEAIEKAKAEAVQLNMNMVNILNDNLSDTDPVKKYLKPYRKDRNYIDSFKKDKTDMFDLIHNIQYYVDRRAFKKLSNRMSQTVEKIQEEKLIKNIDELFTYFKKSKQEIIIAEITTKDIENMGWYVVRVLIPGFIINTPTTFLPIEKKIIQNRMPLPHS